MELSIVIPIYNETEVLPELAERLAKVLTELPSKSEVILVDDGSDKATKFALKSIAEKDHRFNVITLSRNFGHQQALSAGLVFAKGNSVAIMDGDLQDPPELLPRFLAAQAQGFDIVYGIRKNRKENIWLRSSYLLFYRLLARLTEVEVPLDSGDFSLLSRRAVDLINSMPESHRFLRGLRAYIGLRSIGIPYEREPRVKGKPKYTLTKLFSLAGDGVIMFSSLPLRIATISGVTVAFASMLYGMVLVIWRISTNYEIPGFATLAVGMFFLGGVQLICIGLLGEYIARIHDEVKKRPGFIIESQTSSSRKNPQEIAP